jgi:L,D-transpeptidase catalytic domain/Putative peptidoglycan binding domain
MKQRSFIFLAACVAVLIIGAVAAYAYDSSRDDQIADGVTIAGADVGGLSKDQARAVVERRVVPGLRHRLTVYYRHQRIGLRPSAIAMRPDVDGMVDQALHASRDGTIFGRIARDVTGGEENAHIRAEVTYSRSGFDRYIRRVQRVLDRRPVNAHVKFPEVKRVRERDGIQVEVGLLQSDVERALRSPARRTVEAPTKVTQPKVHLADLRKRWPHLIVIQRGAFQLKFYRRLHLVKTYSIAVGQVGLETPGGLYHIESKQVNPSWHVPNSSWAGSLAGRVIPPGPDNPLKARWMGFVDGAGMHGTDQPGSIGSAASHGCIRMFIPDVIELYDRAPLRTPVFVS